ncbi:MAG: hypothetical protein KAG66_20435, partial [Methylococcales bacterium]|nr:hypothetical protein [Methylococcales bacterium]
PPAPEKKVVKAVDVLPDLAQRWLGAGKANAARVWLLLRVLDEAGRGWLTIEDVRNRLTARHSAYYLFGKRQLRNVLRSGDGLFWQRDARRLWLHGGVRVGSAFGVRRFSAEPISIPLSHLTSSIREARAHLYATLHTKKTSQPIARETIRSLCGVSHNSQRLYEAKCGIRTKKNYALGRDNTPENRKQAAWTHGHAAFVWTVTTKKGTRKVIAHQLPNSYQPIYTPKTGRQRKRLNRQLKDLQNKGIAGNIQPDNQPTMQPRRYFTDGNKMSTKRASGYLSGYCSGNHGIWYAWQA